MQRGKRKVVNKYMSDADRQQGKTLSVHHTSPLVSQRNNFLPLPLKKDVSASAVENSTNKTKYS